MLSTSNGAVQPLVGKFGEATKKLKSKTAANSRTSFGSKVCSASCAQSPTSALAKLSFGKSGFSAAEHKSALQSSIVDGKELKKVVERSKLTSGESDALDHDSGSCLTFANEMCSEGTVSNLSSATFHFNETNMDQERSANVLDLILGDPVITAERRCSRTCKAEADDCLQKKRTSPPVRPSSISISSLQFDLGLPRQEDIPSEITGLILSDTGSCKSSAASFEVLTCVTEACKKLHCSPDLIRQVESACRSRSISDLPGVTASALTNNGAVLSDVRPSLMEAAKTSSEACVDRVWHTVLDVRASSGSLSSVGSSSLHGSRELVQVS